MRGPPLGRGSCRASSRDPHGDTRLGVDEVNDLGLSAGLLVGASPPDDSPRVAVAVGCGHSRKDDLATLELAPPRALLDLVSGRGDAHQRACEPEAANLLPAEV